MLKGISFRNKAYYNIRKRYGATEARKIINYWLHFHIDSPAEAEEAILYFLRVGSCWVV